MGKELYIVTVSCTMPGYTHDPGCYLKLRCKIKLLCHAVDSVVNLFVTGLDGLKFKWKVVFLIEHCLTLQIGMFRYYLRAVGLH